MGKQEIIDYLMTTPRNTNKNTLNSMLAGLDNKDVIIAYALHTPHNMNRKVLEDLIGDGFDKAVVGTAVVGTAKVG